MKKITKYQTEDGQLFNKESDAILHEETVSVIQKLRLSILPKRLDTNDFANGSGFIQLTCEQVIGFKTGVEDLLRKTNKDLVGKGSGYVGRALGDSNSPIYNLWGMIAQIDDQHRLWGQPYFAKNPSEAKQKQLNG